MSGWQPIDTAPKDGSEIIGHDGDYVQIIHWETDPDELWNGRPHWCDRDAEPFYAMHWLAISEPPCYNPPTPSAPNPDEP